MIIASRRRSGVASRAGQLRSGETTSCLTRLAAAVVDDSSRPHSTSATSKAGTDVATVVVVIVGCGGGVLGGAGAGASAMTGGSVGRFTRGAGNGSTGIIFGRGGVAA